MQTGRRTEGHKTHQEQRSAQVFDRRLGQHILLFWAAVHLLRGKGSESTEVGTEPNTGHIAFTAAIWNVIIRPL